MSVTLLADVNNQVQTFWSPMFMDELKEQTLLPALVNKDYEGEIKPGGSTVRVSQINRPTATQKTVGSGHEFFDTSKLSTSYIDIVADQVFSAAYEFDDLVKFQSQIKDQDNKVRQALIEAIEIKLNYYLYSLVNPSTSAPDHDRSGIATLDAAELVNIRTLAATAKWAKAGGWWLLADPTYYGNLLSAQTLTSSDYVGDDKPVVGGQIVNQRYGFNILEDNSPSMALLSPTAATSKLALAFHPDWLHLVMGGIEFKVSDLHSNKQFGYVISAKLLGGAKMGISGNVKHIKIYNA